MSIVSDNFVLISDSFSFSKRFVNLTIVFFCKVLNTSYIIYKFITEVQEKYHISPEKTFLLGFSQGTILSYALCLNYPEKFKNIIGFSGYIDEAMINIRSNNIDYGKLNLYISHGKNDPVIPVDWARKSIEILKNNKINYSFNEFNSAHTISHENFYDFKNWLESN